MSKHYDEKEAIPELFGSRVFNDSVMRNRLPKTVYQALKETIEEGKELNPSLADDVAHAMKEWAIENGATHFCHWFQPMTGVTAEKHDSFVTPISDDQIVMRFSGKELSQGESDASSFPSGGLRATFEARGYTAWDCTSPAFIKHDGDNKTLFIPSMFYSYNGHALDQKTPLLRSMDAINTQALRLLRLLGDHETKRVISNIGGEQEYFLIDLSHYANRKDLLFCGRTLFGAPAPKGQEMDDHYYGSLHQRIGSYMADVNQHLWQLGVSAKTQHNEVAPAQYEIAPVFTVCNVASDQNQLVMETLQKIALRHNFQCLLHEKPFAGVNGSGKHDNWSISTNTGINLLKPGATPAENMQFLLFLFAVIRAVDKHAGILRASVASAGNDLRLGTNEAPPAIISIFLGDELMDIYDQIEHGHNKATKRGGLLSLGVSTLPPLPVDTTDRNRTSPFAFTGNKFEFRMPGSSMSLADPNIMLNTMVADAIKDIADRLCLPSEVSLEKRISELLQEYAKKHRRVIFNGDGYTEAWKKEAEERGLLNLPDTVSALQEFRREDTLELFNRHRVFTQDELYARYDILTENYVKCINIEVNTALHMVKRQIIPAVLTFIKEQAQTIGAMKTIGLDTPVSPNLLTICTTELKNIDIILNQIQDSKNKVRQTEDVTQKATISRDELRPALEKLRYSVDKLEEIVDEKIWPIPTYAEMLFHQ